MIDELIWSKRKVFTIRFSASFVPDPPLHFLLYGVNIFKRMRDTTVDWEQLGMVRTSTAYSSAHA